MHTERMNPSGPPGSQDTREVPAPPPPPPPYSQSTDGSESGEPAMEQGHPYDGPTAANPLISPTDLVIAVMGMTGVGKSTFISHFSPTAAVGHGLGSCTSVVGVHEARVGGRKLFLIDTPGFDDTHRTDTDILREVADWLNRSYQAKIQLAGIVYLHRIGDNRMGGASMKNLRMFKKLCGQKGLSSVVLATTMWNTVTPENGARREQELVSHEAFWAGMIKSGSKVLRQDEDLVSATKIIQYIIGQRRRIVLEIQEEMADGKELGDTAAGREVEAELERMKAKHEREMKDLRDEMKEAQDANDLRAQRELATVREELEREIERDRRERELMRVTMKELQEQRDAEALAERQRNHELELQHQKDMLANEFELSKLRIQSEAKNDLLRSQMENERKDAAIARWEALEEERKTCSVM